MFLIALVLEILVLAVYAALRIWVSAGKRRIRRQARRGGMQDGIRKG